MPKLRHKLPSYRLHKPSKQGVVTLNGRDVYLGRYNSAESQVNFKRVVQEWLATHAQKPRAPEPRQAVISDLTINELFLG